MVTKPTARSVMGKTNYEQTHQTTSFLEMSKWLSSLSTLLLVAWSLSDFEVHKMAYRIASIGSVREIYGNEA